MCKDNPENTAMDTIVGKTVISMGLATDEEVAHCLDIQKQIPENQNTSDLASLLVDNNIITQTQKERVLIIAEEGKYEHQIPGFKILGKLGAGAMATVVKANQLSLDRIVAIKVLPKKFMSDPNFVERFYAEGRAAAKLNHPNIVQAYDVGRAGDFIYFVMEYVEGYSVYDYISKNGKYSEAEALDIILHIAEALDHVQSKGMMHRDVKPKNIMITTTGIPKLADMGLARQVTDAESAKAEAGKAYGTPYYISPEQIRGEVDIDIRADIYGLGATFYHMVAGKVPFDGPNPSAVMHKHLKQPLTPPDHINTDLSQGISEIIEVMMAKKRDERYTTTADLLKDLRAVANGKPPLQARKLFNLASLASLEASDDQTTLADSPLGPRLVDQPLFWTLIASILINIVLFVILIGRIV